MISLQASSKSLGQWFMICHLLLYPVIAAAAYIVGHLQTLGVREGGCIWMSFDECGIILTQISWKFCLTGKEFTTLLKVHG